MPDSQSSARSHRPILIVGANGSGTTLLRLMLDSHEHIAIPQETGFLRLALAHLWVPYWELGGDWNRHLDLSDEDLMRELGAFYGGLFTSYAAGRGKQRWGDKTPFHVWHLQLAARMFPEVQVIGIVRHPGAVVSSLRRRFRRPIPRATRHWIRSTKLLIQEASRLGDRCILLRYEDLVTDPAATMRPLLDWLDEPWSDRVLAHHEAVANDAPAEVEGFTRADAPISADRVDDWERHLRGQPLEGVVARTGAVARFLGYDPARSGGLAVLSPDPGRPFLTGVEVAARMAGPEGREVDWSHRPPRRPEDRPLRPPAPARPRRVRNEKRGESSGGDADSGRAAGRRPGPYDLGQVKVRDVLRQRAITQVGARLPDSARRRLHTLRRSTPTIDRLLGPR